MRCQMASNLLEVLPSALSYPLRSFWLPSLPSPGFFPPSPRVLLLLHSSDSNQKELHPLAPRDGHVLFQEDGTFHSVRNIGGTSFDIHKPVLEVCPAPEGRTRWTSPLFAMLFHI